MSRVALEATKSKASSALKCDFEPDPTGGALKSDALAAERDRHLPNLCRRRRGDNGEGPHCVAQIDGRVSAVRGFRSRGTAATCRVRHP